MPRRLILIHTSCLGSITPKGSSPYQWIYFGIDYLKIKRWQESLGETSRVKYKKELQSVSYSIRDSFVHWSAELGREHWQDWTWWITRLAARSTLNSTLYVNICYVEVLKRLLEEDSCTLLIISEDWNLLQVIHDNFSADHELSWRKTMPRLKTAAQDLALFLLRWGRFFQKSLVEWLASRLTRCNGTPLGIAGQGHTLIHTCIDDYCLGEGGNFKDRYYPGLASYLRAQGKIVYTLAWVFNVKKMGIFSLFGWFRQAKEPILIPQDFYGLSDCLVSFLSTVRSGFFQIHPARCRFLGMDYQALVAREQVIQRSSTSTAYFLNLKSIFGRLKHQGLHLESFLDFWELKNCEVPSILGIRKAYPECTIYAYQHQALMARLLLGNFKTTAEEFQAAPHPDYAIANSQTNCNFLKTEGFPSSFVQLGPSLRYLYLKEKRAQKSLPAGEGILVCLPLQLGSACEMLEFMYDAFADNLPKLPVWVKPHPMMDLESLKANLSFAWPEFFLLITGAMDQWLSRAESVVVSDSAVMVESVFYGVKTVVLGKETGLDIIPLDVDPENRQWEYVTSTAELAQALKTPCRASGAEATAGYFEFNMELLDELLNKKRPKKEV